LTSLFVHCIILILAKLWCCIHFPFPFSVFFSYSSFLFSI
jgi:hypothetical protein